MEPRRVDDQLAEAGRLIDGGEFDQARILLLEVTRRAPSPAAWKALGIAENKLGDHHAAERSLRQSLQLDDGDADAWSSLGGVYVALARYDDALQAFERGVTTGSPDTYSLLNYLTMAAIAGDYEQAVSRHAAALSEGRRDCEAQIAQGANIPWCYYDLTQILFFQGSGDDYRVPLREAIGRSADWQAASARRTYELLARSPRFRDRAAAVLDQFAARDKASGRDPAGPPR